ncbi:MAG: Hsp70 family protein, partial [Bacteroidota bacterium]
MARIAIDLKEGKVSNPQDFIIGIDLGTTNSLVAYVKDGQPVAVRGKNGERTLVPSIVHFSETRQILVGDEAKAHLVTHPERTIYSVKRLMGKSYRDVENFSHSFGYQIIDDDPESLVKIRVGDKFFTPIELSAEILKYLKKRIESALDSPISKAVITVPAYFNDSQRQATRDAGKLAGLDVLRIVNEPTAASLAYGLGQTNHQSPITNHQTIAVYDLGGGTFDISILRIEEGIFEVLSTNGDTFLGGDDFDRAIVDFWLEKNGLENRAFVSDKSLSQKLRLKAEEAKKALSVSELFSEEMEGLDCTIHRTEFENLIQPFVEKTIQCCRLALKDAKLGTEKIDAVVMVGGSTRTPLIKNSVAEFFGKPVFDQLDPDEEVALGAAIQPDVLAGKQKDVLLLDI